MFNVCACVCVCQCDHWGSRLCVYMAEFPMTNVVRTSSRFGNVQTKKKKAASSTLLLFFLYKHVLPINQNTVCVCVFFFIAHFYNVIRKQCSLFRALAKN